MQQDERDVEERLARAKRGALPQQPRQPPAKRQSTAQRDEDSDLDLADLSPEVTLSYTSCELVVMEWPAMQSAQEHYSALSRPARKAMQPLCHCAQKSWGALMSMVLCLMLLLLHQPHLDQPWRLNG